MFGISIRILAMSSRRLLSRDVAYSVRQSKDSVHLYCVTNPYDECQSSTHYREVV
jgi:hypothetical protein